MARAATFLDPFGAAEPELQFPLIAGLLLDTNGLPLAGASIELSGDSNRTTNTSATGEFLFDALPEDGTFALAPALNGRIFDPMSMAVSNLFGAEIAVFVERPLEPLSMPVISIRPDTRFDGQLAITWSGDALDYILESTPALPAAKWQRVPEQQLQDVGQVVVPVEQTGGQRFYRLRSV